MKSSLISVFSQQNITRPADQVSSEFKPLVGHGSIHCIIERWSRALIASQKLKSKAEGVRDVIVDIRRLCDELLDKNVDYIKKLNMSITESNKRKNSFVASFHNADSEK